MGVNANLKEINGKILTERHQQVRRRATQHVQNGGGGAVVGVVTGSDKKKQNDDAAIAKVTRKARSDMTESSWLYWPALALFTVFALITRLYKIQEPDHVCWDETHFGKFGSWYINRTFFFDVHPPLGKMLIGLFGALTGYDGTFPFLKPGDKYGDAQYVGMRVCCVLLGACLVPFAFVTVWDMTKSLLGATWAALLILCDNGLVTLSQYILLDPILLFFLLGSVMGNARFRSVNTRVPFTLSWWFWLAFTGLFLACSVSVKFVGLFVVLYVGIFTVWDLWVTLGDLAHPLKHTARHFTARALCLIILPVAVYMAAFYIHLAVLNRSGSGDGFFSSAFQSQLRGNSLFNASMPKEVAYGAVLTLKNHRTGGGYLHSHWHLYPEGIGARQQQVTTYTHKDDNNKWMIKPFDRNVDLNNLSAPVELVKHGDAIRLEHIPTRRNLHGHKEPAPVTKRHYQVTGYGENGIGDANDVWRLEIVGGHEGDVLNTISSRVKLVHFLSGCALHSHNKQLPKWGYEQMEVTCSPNIRDKDNLWNVEDNHFPKLPNVSVEFYAPNFVSKFLESHAIMLQGNSGLKPKEGEVTSKPWQWPLNHRGQFFSGNQFRIYLLGNPLIWWGNLVALAVFFGLALYHLALNQRGYQRSPPSQECWERTISAGFQLFVGWFLHYAPFWVMGRVLYFHHYFPALLFNSLLTGVVLDFLLKICCARIPGQESSAIVFHWIEGIFMAMTVYSFYLFSPLSYGMQGPSSNEPNSTYAALRLLDSWEF